MKKSKKAPAAPSRKVPAANVGLAAEWLAITNLGHGGLPLPKTIRDLRHAVADVRGNPDEVEGAVDEEAAAWRDQIKKDDPFALAELEKDVPFVFEEAPRG